MGSKKKLSLIISIIFAAGFLFYAMFVAIDGADIAGYVAIATGALLPLWDTKSTKCGLNEDGSKN